jgi:predicted dienelactone hydrolase
MKLTVLALGGLGLLSAAAAFVVFATSPNREKPEPMLDPVGPGQLEVGFTLGSTTRTLANGSTRNLEYHVWYPADPAGPDLAHSLLANFPLRTRVGAEPAKGPHPLIVFSHGAGGAPEGHLFLITHLASHGFVVAAPQHRDCSLGCGPTGELLRGQELAMLRPDDVKATLDALLEASDGSVRLLENMIDPERIGLAGFSFGGYSVLRAMEGDPRIRAAVLLAPNTVLPSTPLDPARVSAPLMFLQGEWDANIPISLTSTFYENIPASAPEHWFVVVHQAGHFFATNECLPGRGGIPPCSQSLPQHQAATVIKRWATPFLLAYVGQDDRYAGLIEPVAALPDATIIKSVDGGHSGVLPTPQALPP